MFLHRLLIAGLLFGAALGPVSAHDIDGNVADLVGTLLPSVVNISSIRIDPAASGAARRARTLGSGFVIDSAGIVVTNKHVIEGAREITVTFADDIAFPARLIAVAPQADLAVLRVQTGYSLPALTWGDSDRVRVGESVLAIGNPLGVGESVSAGIVSALNRDIRDTPFDDYIQTDAAINHGNSGGPLFNRAGEVIGINTALYSNVPAGGSIGLGFSIPSNDARFVVDQLIRTGHVRVGWLGVHTQQVTPEAADALQLPRPEGALVTVVSDDASGLETGDVVTAFNNVRIRDVRQFAREVGRAPLGSFAHVAIWRDGVALNLVVKVTEMPGSTAPAPPGGAVPAAVTDTAPGYDLGLRLTPATPEARQLYKLPDDQVGCVVLDVAPAGAAADIGIAEGDVVLRVQQNRVTTPNQLHAAVEALRAQKRHFALLLVAGKDGQKWLTLPLE